MTIDPDTMTFLLIIFVGAACAYFIGFAMNGVMEEDGFGVLMNTTILIAGGFLGFYASENMHLPFYGVTATAVLVVTGGFMSLAMLAVLKGIARKLGF